MTARAVLLIGLLLAPLPVRATTDANLGSRIIIDGRLDDFQTDEWVLDASTPVAERSGDSRWGLDNDVRAIALTWDNYNLYIGVPATTVNSDLMLFIDTMCGGITDFASASLFPRNLSLGAMGANFVLQVTRERPEPRAAYVDCANPIRLIAPDALHSVYLQDGNTSGALEIAIPWEHLGSFAGAGGGTSVPSPGTVLRVVAAITAGAGGGVGDAGPDPTVLLENDSTRVALVNNFVEVPLDGNGDGLLDLGIAPRAVATYASAPASPVRQPLPLTLFVERKVFAPDRGEVVRFQLSLQPDDYAQPVYVTARVYSSSGRLLRRIFEDEARVLGGATAWDEWDGRDDAGVIVPGGIYVIAVAGAAAPRGPAKPVKASIAVIR